MKDEPKISMFEDKDSIFASSRAYHARQYRHFSSYLSVPSSFSHVSSRKQARNGDADEHIWCIMQDL